MVLKTKAHRKKKISMKKRYRERYFTSATLIGANQRTAAENDLANSSLLWCRRQIRLRKKAWYMPCCGASQTGPYPRFAAGHTAKPVLLASSNHADHLDCANALILYLAQVSSSHSPTDSHTVRLPFVSKVHEAFGSDRGEDDAVVLGETQAEEHQNGALSAIQEDEPRKILEQKYFEALDRLRLLELQLHRLRRTLRETRQFQSVASVQTQTKPAFKKKLPSLTITSFSFYFSPSQTRSSLAKLIALAANCKADNIKTIRSSERPLSETPNVNHYRSPVRDNPACK